MAAIADGALGPGPAAASPSPGVLTVVVRSGDGAMWWEGSFVEP